MRSSVAIFAILVGLGAACGACGDDGNTPIDATPQPDIDNGTCGAQLRFTGEYVDWDTDASFCGIFDARFDAQDGSATDNTAPNGRFDVCISAGVEQLNFNVTPSATPSQCTVPPSTYPLPGLVVANKAVILTGTLFSGRNFTIDREATVFSNAGTTFDATKAQLFVHVEGTPRAVSISAAHATTQAVVDTTWAAGDTGHEVFFPNVDVGGGTTELSVTGGAVGTGTIPLAAGKVTSVTVVVR